MRRQDFSRIVSPLRNKFHPASANLVHRFEASRTGIVAPSVRSPSIQGTARNVRVTICESHRKATEVSCEKGGGLREVDTPESATQGFQRETVSMTDFGRIFQLF